MRFRQAAYIKWCKEKSIPDPCGTRQEYQRIISCFIENLTLDTNCRSQTVKEYVKAINDLFARRNFPEPVDFEDRFDENVKLINAIESEETVPNQRSPITSEMFAASYKHAEAGSNNSLEKLMFDFLCLTRICGFRVAEYTQKTQSRIDYHEYASGRQVVKAFLPSDWIFRNKRNEKINISRNRICELPCQLKITFRIQKNRMNGQEITIQADDENPRICPVRAAFRIAQRAAHLNNESQDEPLAVYLNKSGIKKYLTGAKIAELLRKIAKEVHPDLMPKDIKKFSSHSGRVWAVVLLDQAGKSPDFIKSRLRWLGDSYRTYLRDTAVIQTQHTAALNYDSSKFAAILGINANALPNTVPLDVDMGEYNDDDHED